MDPWYDFTLTLPRRDEAKYEAQHQKLSRDPFASHSSEWQDFNNGWLYKRIARLPELNRSDRAPSNMEAFFRKLFFSSGNTPYNLDRHPPPVEGKDGEEISVRRLPQQAGHILGVLSRLRNLHWTVIIRQTIVRRFHAQNMGEGSHYRMVQMTCGEATFQWLWDQMSKTRIASPKPWLIAVPLIPGVVEVIVDDNVILPLEYHKPPNADCTIKDVIDSITLVPCRWSVVDNQINCRHPLE